MNQKLHTSLTDNISTLEQLLPIGTSFDLVTRHLYLGTTPAYWVGINGFCDTDVLQKIIGDLQAPFANQVYSGEFPDESIPVIRNLKGFVDAQIGYAQTTLTDSWDEILLNILSGPSALFVEGFDQAILLDLRSYPNRSVEEPDAERITRGARDGFVETLLTNTNLIRRRVRSPHLIFTMEQLGSESAADVSIAYLDNRVDHELLSRLQAELGQLEITSLTMGTKSLEELLIRKKWYHPLPSLQVTERPDVACSYLMEGHILLLVDNCPLIMIFPGTIFQFTQSPEDYYKSPSVGTYFRLIRFLCIPLSLFLMPVFLLLSAFYPEQSLAFHLLTDPGVTPGQLILYTFTVEFILDLFKYSTSVSSSRFSNTLSLVGGLIIGDIAVELHWASPEVFFFGALTLLSSLSLASIDFADGIRTYRIFLLLLTAIGGIYGFIPGVILILLSMATTPTFGGMSYLWPLWPFHSRALGMLLVRQPTAKAQPCNVWRRKNEQKP